jgi:hypothetical protein
LLGFVVGRAVYTNTASYKEAAERAAAQAAQKEAAPKPELGYAEAVSATRLTAFITLAFLVPLAGITALLIGPPIFVWVWGATQGRRWDWELPEPVHKLKLKPTEKVHGVQAPPEKK